MLGGTTSRPGSSGSQPHPIFTHIGATIFHEGDVLGGRYEIHKMLGMGGMGAVYKARDMEVERVVGSEGHSSRPCGQSRHPGALQAGTGAGAAGHA